MKVVSVGCGGIGGILAAKLARAGVDVTAVTGNPDIAAALEQRGCVVEELDGVRWSAAPAAVRVALRAGDGPFDLCLLGTKATTMQAALADAVPFLAPGARVVCLQNGLPEDVAARVVDPARVVGCVVGWGATMTEPGVYVRTSRGGLQLGTVSGTPDLSEVAELLSRVETTDLAGDLVGVRWSKLALNCASSTLGAIGGERLGGLLRRRYVRRLVLELWSEVAAVARASGVRMALVGGTLDVEKLALTRFERETELGSPALAWKHSILLAVGMKYRRLRSSMLVAIERGRVPEIDYLNGEVVRRGGELGVPTPVNARLVQAVRDVVDGRARPTMDHLRRVFDDLAELRGRPARAAA